MKTRPMPSRSATWQACCDAGAAEAAQRVAGHVDAALDRDLLDRVGHVVVGDGEAALRQLLGRALDAGRLRDLVRQGGERGADHLGVQRLVGRRAEHVREEVGQELADHQVGVGDGERAAAAVAGGAGIGAGTLGADAEALAVEADDRAAAGGHGVDLHHRRPDPHARDLGVEGALEGAGIVGDVGRGAAHVEADDPVEPGQGRGLGGTDDAAGRAGQDGVLALEQARVDQPAIALHEHQPHIAGLGGDPVDIGAQDRRQVGVDHGGVAAADQLHQRADLVADRDLGEADLGRAISATASSCCVVAVAVHQHDRDRPVAGGERALQVGAGALAVERLLDRAVGAQPLLDLDRARVELLGQDDVAGEDVGPVLVGDAQRVAEAAGDREHGGRALALEQRVGRDRGAHLDRLDRGVGQRLALAPGPAGRGCPGSRRRGTAPGSPTAACGCGSSRRAPGPPRR